MVSVVGGTVGRILTRPNSLDEKLPSTGYVKNRSPYPIETPFPSTFAGCDVPQNDILKLAFEKKLCDNIIFLNPHMMPIFFKKYKEIIPIVDGALIKQKLPLELKNIPIAESSLREDARSHKDAVGIWQIRPVAARDMKLKIHPKDERLDPEKSTQAAIKYLNRLHDKF